MGIVRDSKAIHLPFNKCKHNIKCECVCALVKKGEDVNRCLFLVHLIQTHFFTPIKAVMNNLRKCFLLLAHGVLLCLPSMLWPLNCNV